jgi:thiamine pyrophosphokinase
MNRIIILANGSFPTHKIALSVLHTATQIICCDGATQNLINYGLKPNLIIGDLDSISSEIRKKYSDIIIQDKCQDTNDLTKAVNWCVANNISEITILGATGKREDHTLGNISLLMDYSKLLNVKMISDFGIFTAISKSTKFKSFVGQQISIFSLEPETEITSENLKFPLQKLKLKSLWMGTLNEALSNNFSINFENGKIIVFQAF